MSRMKTLKITPDMFVSKPDLKCPKCKAKAYGVIMINRKNYVRRCNKCVHSESYKLPKIEKNDFNFDVYDIEVTIRGRCKK